MPPITVTPEDRPVRLHVHINHRNDGQPPEIGGCIEFETVFVDDLGKISPLIPTKPSDTIPFTHAQVGAVDGWDDIYAKFRALLSAIKSQHDAAKAAAATAEAKRRAEEAARLEAEAARLRGEESKV